MDIGSFDVWAILTHPIVLIVGFVVAWFVTFGLIGWALAPHPNTKDDRTH